MKKLFHIIAAAALLGGLAGCGQKEQAVVQAVDLRYRCESEYNLAATGARPFTIVVTSSAPWSVTSSHPDWCIISDEEGEASPAEAVHVGQGTKTNVRVQYYDNTALDDREDEITIASDYWVGKVIKVYQKGIAYLTVPAEELEQPVAKAGGDITFQVKSNQNWSAAVTEGYWLSIVEGATGTGDGTITVTAEENASELRYAKVTVYDRNQVAMATVNFTQDGVQLVPAAYEIRAGYDQIVATVGIAANAKWQVLKGPDEPDWITIDTPTGEGDGIIQISLTPNQGESIRKSSILVRNVSTNPDDPVVEKEIEVKQAYKVLPKRYIVDDDEIAKFDLEWANAPVYTKDVGTLFKAQSRLHNGSMPFGTYTFRWSNFTPDPAGAEGLRCRHWFCFGEGAELKFDIRPVDGKISFDFNAAGDGNKPSIDAYTNVDFNQPIEITYKFDPSGTEYCKVTYLVNGVVAGTFETSEKLLRTVKWGEKINMYFGADKSGSAILEWYEYTEPLNWDE
jgi:hypothetical protein